MNKMSLIHYNKLIKMIGIDRFNLRCESEAAAEIWGRVPRTTAVLLVGETL